MNFEFVSAREFVGADELDDGLLARDQAAFFENFRGDFDGSVKLTKNGFKGNAFDDVGENFIVEAAFRNTT